MTTAAFTDSRQRDAPQRREGELHPCYFKPFRSWRSACALTSGHRSKGTVSRSDSVIGPKSSDMEGRQKPESPYSTGKVLNYVAVSEDSGRPNSSVRESALVQPRAGKHGRGIGASA